MDKTSQYRREIQDIMESDHRNPKSRFDLLKLIVETMYPDWRLVPTSNAEVKSSHPITVGNQSEYFHVHDVAFNKNSIPGHSSDFYVRGEETFCFGLKGITPKEKED